MIRFFLIENVYGYEVVLLNRINEKKECLRLTLNDGNALTNEAIKLTIKDFEITEIDINNYRFHYDRIKIKALRKCHSDNYCISAISNELEIGFNFPLNNQNCKLYVLNLKTCLRMLI